MANTSLFKTIIHALLTSMGMRVLSMALRFITICLLPLWLMPAEIGYTALLLIIVNIAFAIADFGFGTALIKSPEATPPLYQSVFTFTAISSAVIVIIIILCAPLLESVFTLPAWLTVIAAFAISFNAFAIVPNALLQRELRFTSIAIRDFIGEIAFSATAIVLAYLGYGALSLAVAIVAHRFVRWIIVSLSIHYQARFYISITELRQLAGFSFYQFTSILLTQIFNQLDKLLLGMFLTPTTLGYYSQAQQMTVTPIQSLTGAAKNVFFASFAKIQDNDEMLRSLFVKITRWLWLLAGIYVGLLAPALHLVPIVYKSEWAAAVPIGIALCATIPLFCAEIFEGIMIAIGGERRRILSAASKIVLLIAGCTVVFTAFSNTDAPIAMGIILGISIFASVIINLHYIFKRLTLSKQHIINILKLAIPGLLFAIAGICLSIYML